jgi:predicted LPLAT superfamily acyltransferase
MTGDIVWREGQRSIAVNFLGHVAYVPEAPFIFAMVSGAPIFAFFAFRTGVNRYRFSLSEAIAIHSATKAERQKCIAEAAQRYADLLEEALRAHPFEWYHFDRFLHAPSIQSTKSE